MGQFTVYIFWEYVSCMVFHPFSCSLKLTRDTIKFKLTTTVLYTSPSNQQEDSEFAAEELRNCLKGCPLVLKGLVPGKGTNIPLPKETSLGKIPCGIQWWLQWHAGSCNGLPESKSHQTQRDWILNRCAVRSSKNLCFMFCSVNINESDHAAPPSVPELEQVIHCVSGKHWED